MEMSCFCVSLKAVLDLVGDLKLLKTELVCLTLLGYNPSEDSHK